MFLRCDCWTQGFEFPICTLSFLCGNSSPDVLSSRQSAGHTSFDGGCDTPGPRWCICCRDWHEMHEVHGRWPGEEDADGCLWWGHLHNCRLVTYKCVNTKICQYLNDLYCIGCECRGRLASPQSSSISVSFRCWFCYVLAFCSDFCWFTLFLIIRHGVVFPSRAGLSALVATSWYGNRVARAFYDPFTPVNTRYRLIWFNTTCTAWEMFTRLSFWLQWLQTQKGTSWATWVGFLLCRRSIRSRSCHLWLLKPALKAALLL